MNIIQQKGPTVVKVIYSQVIVYRIVVLKNLAEATPQQPSECNGLNHFKGFYSGNNGGVIFLAVCKSQFPPQMILVLL